MTQEKSAALRYREMVAEQRKAAFTYKEVNPETGFEWELRELDIPELVMSGKLPLTFLEMMVEAEKKGGNPLDTFEHLPDEEKIESVRTMQYLVQLVAVSPKIVKEAKNDDEIDVVLKADFGFLLLKALTGRTKTAAALATFRQGQGQTASDSSNVAKLRRPTVKSAKSRKRSARA